MAQRRKIHEIAQGNRVAKVYRDSDWEEFRVTLWVDGAKVDGADYHTDCKADAIDTAAFMVKPLPARGFLFQHSAD